MRAMRPDDLYAITGVSECDISPDGKTVAFVATKLDKKSDSYVSAIWVAAAKGGEPRQFTAGTKRDGSPRWSPDGKQLAFVSERGEEKPQLYVMAADGGEARALTKLPLGAGVPAWSPDGASIAFSAKTGDAPDPDPKKAKPYRRITSLKYRVNGEGFTYDHRRHLFVVGLDGDDPRQLTDGDWDDTQPAWSPDGRSIAFVSARHARRDFGNDSDVWVVAAKGGRARKLTATKGACKAPSWSPDGQTIAHIHTPTWPANGTLRLASAMGGDLSPVDTSFDRDTGAGAVPGAVAQPAWLPGGAILSLAADRGRANLVVSTGEGTRTVGSADQMLSWYSVSANGKTAAVVGSTVTSPGEVSIVDVASGKQRQLTSMNQEWLAKVQPAAGKRMVVRTADGVEVDCWVMKPAGFKAGKKYPVILNVHGGPFGQFGETFFDEFQVYTGAGYGVVFCNPRGSSGQDTAFARAVVGDMGGPDYHDVMAAFDAALAGMPWADTKRLAVMGGSYGGFMTSWVIGHTNRFKAAISERAVNDWYSMQGASDIGATFNRQYLGEKAVTYRDLDAVLRQSPLTYAGKIETPVLILHSEDDLRCPISQAEQLWVILKLRGKDVEFVRFPDENHELSRTGRPSHRVDRFEVILEYLKRKL
jgi:dipeptidyl aminopeptidase/acylaminoacyl peptidase